MIEQAHAAAARGLVPMGLPSGARVVKDVPQGAVLTAADGEIDETSAPALLRRLRDKLLAGEAVDIAA